MAGGVKIKLDADARGVERANRRVAKSYERIADKARKASRQTARVRPTAQGARQTAEAVTRFGGKTGGVAGQFSGALGAGTRMGVVAGLGFAAAGVAVGAFTAHMREAADVARETVQVYHNLRDATKAAEQSADGMAKAQFAALRRLRGVGGDAAIAMARGVAKRGGRGAVAGVTALAERRALTPQAVTAAEAAAATGQTTFGEAAKKIAEGVRVSGQVTRDAARILNAMGQRVGAADVARMQGNISAGGRGRTMSFTRAAEGNLMDAIIHRALNTRGIGTTANLAARDVRDPRAAARRRMDQQLNREIESLQKQAEASGTVFAVMQEAGAILGLSEGSYERRINNKVRSYRSGVSR